jgi:hypothetical protein
MLFPFNLFGSRIAGAETPDSWRARRVRRAAQDTTPKYRRKWAFEANRRRQRQEPDSPVEGARTGGSIFTSWSASSLGNFLGLGNFPGLDNFPGNFPILPIFCLILSVLRILCTRAARQQ